MAEQFLRNAWYCVGWRDDIGLGQKDLVSRRIAGQSLLFYRTPEGELVAMEDRCPHRSAPLSLGRKEGDAVRCMYHGLLFGKDGACKQVPGMDRIPPGAAVPTFAVCEKDGWIWVWLGDADEADEALVCDAFDPDDPELSLRKNSIRIETNYRQEIANLADLSHISWVHDETFGGTEEWAFIKPRHKREARGIETSYVVRNIPAPRFVKHMFPNEARFDIQVHIRLSVPCNFIMNFRIHEADGLDKGDARGPVLLDTYTSQAVTPRDEGSIDYYFSWGASKETEFPGVVDLMYRTNFDAFLEDKRILEGQRERQLQYPDAPQIDIVHDGGPGQMLWVLDKLLAIEAPENSTETVS